jgi:hypothetical protein
MPTGKTYLCTPTFDRKLDMETHCAIVAAHLNRGKRDLMDMTSAHSLLCHGFNTFWVDALNRRQTEHVDRFVMLHADVAPLLPDWLPKLLKIMDDHRLDVLSAVVPIKTQDGSDETSTAAEKGMTRRRLRQSEIEEFPRTFNAQWFFERDGEILLTNTGLMAVRLTAPWVDEFPGFTIQDAIYFDDDGKYQAGVIPEDWMFSHWLHEHGVRYGATTAIPVKHVGTASWIGNVK